MKTKLLEWTQAKPNGNWMAIGESNIYIYRKNKKKFVLIVGNQLYTDNITFTLKTERACRIICHNLEFR